MFEKCNCTAGTTFCEKYKISVNTRQHQFLRGDSGLSRNVEEFYVKELLQPNPHKHISQDMSNRFIKRPTAQEVMDFTNSVEEFLLQGMPKVDDNIYAERLSSCDVCEYVDKSIQTWRCKLCGCNLKEGPILPGRARWATKDCPDPKGSHWPKVELPVITQKPPGRSCCGGR
jgi:hypothetical protein